MTENYAFSMCDNDECKKAMFTLYKSRPLTTPTNDNIHKVSIVHKLPLNYHMIHYMK